MSVPTAIPTHNPFFEHAQAAFWLAMCDGEPVGRITAQIDALHQARYHDDTGHFGFMEAIYDPAVFAALLAVAEAWLKAQGMRRSVGPVSFSMRDEPGLLVEGFGTPPSVLMGHALPYYQTHIAAQSYAKIQDLVAYDYENGRPLPDTMAKIIVRSDNKHGIRYRYIRRKREHFEEDVSFLRHHRPGHSATSGPGASDHGRHSPFPSVSCWRSTPSTSGRCGVPALRRRVTDTRRPILPDWIFCLGSAEEYIGRRLCVPPSSP